MRVGRGPLERQSTRVIIKVGGEEWASHQILEVCVFESVHAERQYGTVVVVMTDTRRGFGF